MARAEPDGRPGQAGGHEGEAGQQRRGARRDAEHAERAAPPRPVRDRDPLGEVQRAAGLGHAASAGQCSTRPRTSRVGSSTPRYGVPICQRSRAPSRSAARASSSRLSVAEALDGRRAERAELRVHVRRARPRPRRPRRARTGSGACARSARSRRCRARGRARRTRRPSWRRPSAGRCGPAAASGRASAGRTRRWWRSSCRPGRSAAGSSSPRRAARGCRRGTPWSPSTNSRVASSTHARGIHSAPPRAAA